MVILSAPMPNTPIKHGHSPLGKPTPTYTAWLSMKDRVTNKKAKAYPDYGGRGITICDKWLYSFSNFLHDMGIRSDNMSIERIDNNGNYEPSNCRWATKKEQQRNLRSNIWVDHNGKRQLVRDWANEFNISEQVLGLRLHNGWDIQEALTKPVRTYKKRG